MARLREARQLLLREWRSPVLHGAALDLVELYERLGDGRLWTQKPGCSPSYKCPYYSRWVGVYLNTVRWHNGVRYYARMAVEFYYAGKWRWDVGWFPRYLGGTMPVWLFPAVFPYL